MLAAAACTIAASILSMSFAIEKDGGRDTKDVKYAAVFGLDLGNWDAGGSVCTGFLVHPQLIITAAHCVYDYSIANLTNAPDLRGRTRGYANPSFKKPVIFPKYRELRKKYGDEYSGHLDIPQNDFAYIYLKKPVTGVTPFVIKSIHDLSGEDLFQYMNKPVTTTGYGVTIDRGKQGDYSADSKGVKRVGSSVIEDLSAMLISMSGSYGNILPGDSGGPILSVQDSGTYVIGLNQSVSRIGDKYDAGMGLGLRKELICWAAKDTQLALTGVTCP